MPPFDYRKQYFKQHHFSFFLWPLNEVSHDNGKFYVIDLTPIIPILGEELQPNLCQKYFRLTYNMYQSALV